MSDTASSTSPRHDLLVAIGYGAAIWVVATALILTLGPALVPEEGSRAGVLVILVFAALAFGLAVLASLLYRRTRIDSIESRLRFGTGIAATGLLLDAVVYGVATGRYPLLADSQQGPIAFFLVLAYGALLVAPHAAGRARG
ncbi:hypothetical protein [Gulosibacter sp. 10]|uniref:hypothetical protein n=1 Tax=Gulosibacter sp. 10 TaxID=1255570 RepID=UPI000B3531D4|nr:hypothetical protein [Gulosibacter sp. 10]